MKIRTKLTVFEILVLVLSVAATITPIYVKSGLILMELKRTKISRSVDTITTEVTGSFDRFLRDLTIVMTDREVVELMKVAKFTKKYDPLLKKIGFVKTLMGYDAVHVFDRKGMFIQGKGGADITELPGFAMKMEKEQTIRRIVTDDGGLHMLFYGPIYYKNQFLGTIAIEKNLDTSFLSSFNHSGNVFLAMFEKEEDGYGLVTSSNPDQFSGVRPVPAEGLFPRSENDFHLKEKVGIMQYSVLPLGEEPDRFLLGCFEDKHEVQAVHSQILSISLVVGGIAVAVGCAAVFLFSRSLAAPLGEAARFSRSIARGDLSRTLSIRRKDEIGELCDAQNSMVQELSDLIYQVVEASGNMESYSGDLFQISDTMAEESKRMSHQNGDVMNTSEKLSMGMSSVAAAMEQSTVSVEGISLAAGDMKDALGEISEEMVRAVEITQSSTDRLGASLASILKFNEAVREIDFITGTISDISSKTRLLALNATIESARARGGTGAGFSVLASEIKDLAGQTAEATDHIKRKIEGLHGVSNQATEEMEQFVDSTRQVHDIVHEAVQRIFSQNRLTSEITDHVVQVSGGIAEVNQSIARSSSGTESIHREIGQLNEVSTRISGGSDSVKRSAETLKDLARDLAMLVGRFRLSGREGHRSVQGQAVSAGIIKVRDIKSDVMSSGAVI